MYTDLIYENYDSYLRENQDDFSSPSNAIQMLTSDGAFNAYISALTEGLQPQVQAHIHAIAQREREMLLEEAVQLGPSASIIGYAVTYFPILTDIYAEPVLSQICTPYPTNKAIVTIPKFEVVGTVKNSDGSTSTYKMPRPQYKVRGGIEKVNITPNTNNNLFTLSSGGLVTSASARINKRYFDISAINVTDNVGGTNHTYDVPVYIRPDARGQIEGNISFNDSAATACTGKLIGNIDWDAGTITYSVVFTGTVGVTYTCNHAACDIMYSPTSGDVGRVKIQANISGWDVNVDIRDDFEIELQTEMIQDYRDIYNIDLIRTMGEAIKTQILLNKDQDISYFLQANEPEMTLNGTTATVDLDKFALAANEFRPTTVVDVLKGLVPHINSVARLIHLNFRAAPQYIVAGLKTAALLDSLQEYLFNMPEVQKGEYGFAAGNISFRKMTIVPCLAVPDSKIYLLYKPPAEDPSRSAILDIVYKPLYIIEEITNSLKRTFVKSRTAIEVVAPTAIGSITVQNINHYL